MAALAVLAQRYSAGCTQYKGIVAEHGRAESIISNATEFVDIMTISSKAEDITYYDEWDHKINLLDELGTRHG